MTDNNARSFTKAVSWRAVGTLDTILLSLFITGRLTTAVSIGLTEVITKVVLYYLHERLWNKITWGRKEKGPMHARSVVKGLSWRLTGTLDTILLAFIYTHELSQAITIGSAELITKVVLYYLHERAWSLTKWGRVSEEKRVEILGTGISPQPSHKRDIK